MRVAKWSLVALCAYVGGAAVVAGVIVRDFARAPDERRRWFLAQASEMSGRDVALEFARWPYEVWRWWL